MLLAAGLVVVLGGVLALVTGSADNGSGPADGPTSGGAKAGRSQPAPVRDPRKLLGKEIHVGPAGDFKTINAAVDYVREHFRPRSPSDRQVIQVAGGLTYSERLDLSGGKANGKRAAFPHGVNIVCTDHNSAILEPVGGEPVVRLDGVQRLRLEGFELRASGPVAVELRGFLEGTQLRELRITGFAEVGVLGQGAYGAGDIGRQRNELVLENIVFPAGSGNAVGLRLEGADTARIDILKCRFFQPLATGAEIGGEARFVELRHCLFANIDVGVRFPGSALLSNVTLAHNTFYHVQRGVVFAEMPKPSSLNLAFHRNLFDQVGSAEVVVESGFDQRQFEALLAAGGPEQNWTTRSGDFPSGAIDLFTTRGRRGAAVNHASTDSSLDRFLTPAPDSPHANVPAGPSSGLQPYVGAIGP